jgi:hypothetical protein
MDANTHKTHEEGKRQGVIEFAQHLAGLNLATCWGAGKGKPFMKFLIKEANLNTANLGF